MSGQHCTIWKANAAVRLLRWHKNSNASVRRLCLRYKRTMGGVLRPTPKPSTVDQEALQYIPQKCLHEDLDLPSSVNEVNTAIKEMNSGKTSGAEGIPAELHKALSATAFNAFRDILVSILEEECMKADFGDATIITLYKNKGAFLCVRCNDRAKSSGRWLLGSPLPAVLRQLAPRAWCLLQFLLVRTVGVPFQRCGQVRPNLFRCFHSPQ